MFFGKSVKKYFFAGAFALFWLVFLCIGFTACTLPGEDGQVQQVLSPGPVEKAEVLIWVELPEQLAEGESVELVLIDEVTGIPFNQKRLQMTHIEGNVYGVLYLAALESVLIYRYELVSNGSRFIEHSAGGEPVDKRLFIVHGPSKAYDVVAGFNEKLTLQEAPGYIVGQVMHAETGNPLSDILVFCEGIQAKTDGMGRFVIYPLIPGEHRITTYAMNGSYLPYQQQVITEEIVSTPVEIAMQPASWKKVTFTVTIPEDTFAGAPIRMAGNLSQLGSTFSDLGGGITGDVHNMPVLVTDENGRFSLTIQLPAGIDIRYKYTIGDGFWNAEHGLDQNFVVHQLIISPDADDQLYIHDAVATWESSQTEAIWFDVRTPPNTPTDESIGIQFQLADWMPALPMFNIEEGRWAYPLISPHNFSSAISYRYCRNGPCTGTYQPGVEALPVPRETTTQYFETQLISEEVNGWVTLQDTNVAIHELSETVEVKGEAFVAGITYSPHYSLSSLPYMDNSIQKVSAFSNLAIFSPAWVGLGADSPILFHVDPLKTPEWHEIAEEIEHANDLGLSSGLFPQMLFAEGYQVWWNLANTEDEAWWQQWYIQYREYIYQFAELAEKTEADYFVIGGEWILPALPLEGHFETYNQTGNIEQFWIDTIARVGKRFSGVIALQVPIEKVASMPPSLLGSIDQLFVLWDVPLEPSSDGMVTAEQVGELLDSTIEPIKTNLNIPVVVVLAYPAAQGFSDGCIISQVEPDTCLDELSLVYGPSEQIQAATDLNSQLDFYRVALEAVSAREWVDGVISQGYYPAIAMHDPSASIHGKPTEEIVIDWYLRFLGK